MSLIQKLFIENIRYFRKVKKLSQQEVAEKSGMLASTYNRIENMKVTPSIDTAEKIAKALEISFVELFQDREISNKTLNQKIALIESLSDYNKNVVSIMMDTVFEKDTLEKEHYIKMNKRLTELNKIRKS
ncbi:helix-turn-helix domain-containing protein [Pontimicrobium sp. MEBiC01747]